MRRGSIVQLVVLGLLFGAGAAAVALLIPWLPDPASKQADRIDFVFWFVTAICIAIFALVAAVIVYAVFNFRAEQDSQDDQLDDRSPAHRGRDYSTRRHAVGGATDAFRALETPATSMVQRARNWVRELLNPVRRN